MKQILMYHGKYDYEFWDASTPESTSRALGELFKYLDEFGCYCELDAKQQLLYDRAKTGDLVAAKKLLTVRQRYEYEDWSIYPVRE